MGCIFGCFQSFHPKFWPYLVSYNDKSSHTKNEFFLLLMLPRCPLCQPTSRTVERSLEIKDSWLTKKKNTTPNRVSFSRNSGFLVTVTLQWNHPVAPTARQSCVTPICHQARPLRRNNCLYCRNWCTCEYSIYIRENTIPEEGCKASFLLF